MNTQLFFVCRSTFRYHFLYRFLTIHNSEFYPNQTNSHPPLFQCRYCQLKPWRKHKRARKWHYNTFPNRITYITCHSDRTEILLWQWCNWYLLLYNKRRWATRNETGLPASTIEHSYFPCSFDPNGCSGCRELSSTNELRDVPSSDMFDLSVFSLSLVRYLDFTGSALRDRWQNW